MATTLAAGWESGPSRDAKQMRKGPAFAVFRGLLTVLLPTASGRAVVGRT